MKKSILFFFIALVKVTILNAQIFEPVEWTTSVEKVTATEYSLVSTATIDPGWHMYSQEVPEDGPISTSFNYNPSGGFEVVGPTKEEKGHTVHDPVFDMVITYFEDKAEFRQQINLLDPDLESIEGEVEFMVCDDEKCLPPTTVSLTYYIKGKEPTFGNSVGIGTLNGGQDIKKVDAVDIPSAEPEQGKQGSDKRGLWGIFFIAFLSGFAALLTPCVFPMIPMTVSFFTKQSETRAKGVRNAIIYGLAIIVIYVLLGTAVTAIFGADSLNALATNVWFNLLFFLLLVVFALSFLGAFEILLPNSWTNKVDKQSDRGGVIGIFFMALALALVSFSCTGPIVGTLLVEAALRGGIGPIVGMFGFSLAIALPFALFAAFPGWMNSLPKSGGWLNTVKVFLGFLELALAFKFLSQADLVLQLHLLEREVFLSIWIAIFGALALYLFGKIQLPHDSPTTNISVGRLSMGLLVLAFTIYMVPGLWGAPLKLISAFPPPLEYSESPYGVGYTKAQNGSSVSESSKLPEGAHWLPPHDILAFNDYDKGLAYAKKVGKPVMLDFTGWACVNCRKMEQNVWPDSRVLHLLKNEVVLVSLYVDDKRELETAVDSKLKPGKKLKYIGQKWSEFQTLRYQANTQPFYVLIGHDEQKLAPPTAYTPDADDYYDWLNGGIDKFKKVTAPF
ncbi:thioredoxin family protein [Flavobacteriaceae bacterium F89]|uniref:Thioredoxin family protein n=1 Tax=Cerina litoralis TaxID=2874477 RepID=A0AAE3ERG2_9FLAO|nr:cytochrome c biogenesis protein CcdA [Cerina litoralis]MCG2459725.1 thioredoxin family protein [Cerina litoralis]